MRHSSRWAALPGSIRRWCCASSPKATNWPATAPTTTASIANRQRPFARMSRTSKRLLRGYRRRRRSRLSRADLLDRPRHCLGPCRSWREEGYRYSSSVYPVRHDIYGSPGAPHFPFASLPRDDRDPADHRAACWARISPPRAAAISVCFPTRSAAGSWGRRVPPVPRPPVFYLHPWEVDPAQPRQRQAPLRSRARHYLNLGRTEPRLRRLLRDFAWTRLDRLYLSHASGPYPLIPAWMDYRRSR